MINWFREEFVPVIKYGFRNNPSDMVMLGVFSVIIMNAMIEIILVFINNF